MQIDELELERFRNYERQSVTFDPGCNVILGENAQGKTNLLEAVQYLSCGKSERARYDRELIQFSADNGRLAGTVETRQRRFLLEAELYRTGRRRLHVNRVPAKSAAALSQVFQTVFFRPEDLLLIREGAVVRRRFLDQAICQLRPRYAAALASYRKAYAHKTRILKDHDKQPSLLEMLPEFNERLARCGAALIRYRAQFVEKLALYAAANHGDCSGGRERLTVEYQTVSTVREPMGPEEETARALREHMDGRRAAELAARQCLSGPHRDDLLVQIDGREAKTYSSQGQTRTAALSLKLAEREIFKNVTGEAPVLLLDDVLSELDPRRQEFVLNRIAGGQVLITCCEEDRLPCLLGGKIFRAVGGSIAEQSGRAL